MKLLALVSGWLVALALIPPLVSSVNSNMAKQQEIERENCACKPEINGRVFYASICQSGSIKDPGTQECLYR